MSKKEVSGFLFPQYEFISLRRLVDTTSIATRK